MQEQTQLREDSWQSPPCSKLEHMLMNDKQSKLVRSSTARRNDLPKQMQARRSLTTSVDNCPSTSIAGTNIYCNGNQSQLNRCNRSPFIKTQRNCHRSYTSPTRYLNKSSTTTTTTPLLRHFQHPSPPAKSPGLNVSRSQETQAD